MKLLKILKAIGIGKNLEKGIVNKLIDSILQKLTLDDNVIRAEYTVSNTKDINKEAVGVELKNQLMASIDSMLELKIDKQEDKTTYSTTIVVLTKKDFDELMNKIKAKKK